MCMQHMVGYAAPWAFTTHSGWDGQALLQHSFIYGLQLYPISITSTWHERLTNIRG